MIPASPGNLLHAAKAFMRTTATKAALAIAPLAAAGVATEAKAQVVFNAPGGGGGVRLGAGSGTFVHASGGSFFGGIFPESNGINGRVFGANIFFVTHSGGMATAGVAFQGTGSGTFTTSSYPVAYNFVLGSGGTGTITALSWELVLNTNTGSSTFSQVIASGNSLGHAIGSSAYATQLAGLTDYDLSLMVTYTSTTGAHLTFAMDGQQGQGLAINPAAVPEPATYAIWLGAGTLVVCCWRRVRPGAAG